MARLPLLFTLALSSVTNAASCATAWPGFKSLKHLFVFGDSYTQTGFNDRLAQPSASNPLGNPAYPGWTSSNGPNWVDFLTTTYNESLLLAYNLAYGGATVDAAYVAPYMPTVLSLKQQVQDEFILSYGASNKAAPWNGSDSLFAFWIGINDIGNSYWMSNESAIQDAIFAEYGGLLDKIYDTGGRNFLFLNVPSVQRSPLVQSATTSSYDAASIEQSAIQQWNGRVNMLASGLKSRHPDVTTVTYDTYTLFNEVLDDPQRFERTAIYKNTTGYCPDYENGTPAWDTYIASCKYPVNQYFWLNTLHPTYPMHNLTGYEIAQTLDRVTANVGQACRSGSKSRVKRRSWSWWAYE